MNKFFVFLILFLGVIVVVFSFGELETILQTLQKAHLGFFLLAILIQIAWFVTSGRMYQSIFHLLGIHEDVLTLSRIAAAANFINVVAPTAGAGGVALFAAEAKRRGHPAGKATVAAALFLLLDLAAFLIILSLGLIVLVRRNDLDAGEISASLILFTTAAGFTSVLYIGYRSAEKLTCDYYGKEQDYTRKIGVEHTQIYAPENTNINLSSAFNIFHHTPFVF